MKLKNRLPLIITNDNCILVTRENHSGYALCEEIGKYYFEYPFQFTQGDKYPKEIVIDNIAVFNEKGQEQMGVSVHCGFNTESMILDQCIGFITYIHKTTKWQVTKTNKGTLIWFKDISGKLFNPYRFVLIGSYNF